MISETSEAGRDITGMLGETCVELFEAYGVSVSPSGQEWKDTGEPVLSAVIGFVSSDLRGTCLIAANESLLQNCCPSGSALRDWVGELSNQLIGRLKGKLLARNVQIGLTTPLTFSAVRVVPCHSTAVLPRVFTSAVGPVLLFLEVEADDGFVLGEAQTTADGKIGDALFFD